MSKPFPRKKTREVQEDIHDHYADETTSTTTITTNSSTATTTTTTTSKKLKIASKKRASYEDDDNSNDDGAQLTKGPKKRHTLHELPPAKPNHCESKFETPSGENKPTIPNPATINNSDTKSPFIYPYSDDSDQETNSSTSNYNKKKKITQQTVNNFKKWNEYYQQLVHYHSIHGHSILRPNDIPPHKSASVFDPTVNYNLYELANWVQLQKRYCSQWERGVKNPSITVEKIALLEKVDFFVEEEEVEVENNTASNGGVTKGSAATGDSENCSSMEDYQTCTTNGKKRRRWHQHYIQLRTVYTEETNKNPFVQKDTIHKIIIQQQLPQLHRWCLRQRSLYKCYFTKMIPSPLTIGRIRALERIGFQWESKTDQVWNRRVRELRAYQSKHGDCRVPRICEDFSSLGRWVASLRGLYRKQQRQKNATMDDPNDGDDGCHKSLSGSSSEPSQIDSSECETGSLTEERIKILEDMGFEWESTRKGTGQNGEVWKGKYQELKKWREEHGHCRVPRSEKGLGTWVRNQRNQYWTFQKGNKSPITAERIADLERLGFQWKLRGTSKKRN